MAVLDPLKVTISNWNSKFPSIVKVPDFPNDPSKTASHDVPFDKIVFIDRDDFREVKRNF